MGSYWGKVAKRAFKETREAIRLETPVRIVTGIVAPIASGLIVWLATGNPLQGGAVTVAIVILIGACLFLGKLTTVPAKMAREDAEERTILAGQIDQRMGRQTTREALGNLILEGQGIIDLCRQELADFPVGNAEDWSVRAEATLAPLGADYIARFRSPAGLPMRASAIQKQPHRTIAGNVNFRCARLQEFIRELL
jgi:hypothetical protein